MRTTSPFLCLLLSILLSPALSYTTAPQPFFRHGYRVSHVHSSPYTPSPMPPPQSTTSTLSPYYAQSDEEIHEELLVLRAVYVGEGRAAERGRMKSAAAH